MSFQPPSPSGQPGTPFPASTPLATAPRPGSPSTPPPIGPPPGFGQQSPFGTGGPVVLPGQGVPPFTPPGRSGGANALRLAMLMVPLIGMGIGAFVYFDAKGEAEELRDDALASIDEALDDAGDIAIGEPVVVATTAVAVPESVVSSVAPEPATGSGTQPGVIAAGEPVAVETTVAAPAAQPGALWTAEGSAALFAAYEAAVSGEPSRFLDMAVYGDYAFATAQDAAVPAHVDEYPFRDGVIGASSPVELFGNGDLEAALWSFADVDLTQLPRLVAEAPGLTSVEEPSVVYVRIERSVFHPGFPVTMKVYVDGPRGSAYVEYDAAGTLIQVV